ncbi:unnamed protein product [Cuscuta epithymum]|uniref:Nucleoprotein n=1 Tax=Cuscuta epithymum TaxID=186058 RepID=A0AAV0CZ95_9ASTE|nr:unnamed protein product [Cuscuta epithymum]
MLSPLPAICRSFHLATEKFLSNSSSFYQNIDFYLCIFQSELRGTIRMADLTELNNCLRQIKARRQATIQPQLAIPQNAIGVNPAEVMALDMTDPNALLKARLANLMMEPVSIPEANKTMFLDFPNINANLQVDETDFPDDKYIRAEGYFIFRTDINHLCLIGRQVIPMLSSGFNTEGVIGLLLLAYNLRVPRTNGEEFVFEELDPHFSVRDVAGETVVSVQYSGAETGICCRESGNPINDAIFYCYLAASTLRLFTRSPENYIGAWTNIIARFSGFYGFTPPVHPLAPTQLALSGLHSAFSSDNRMRMTLYKIIYSTGPSPKCEGLRRFLYENYLANTGLHAVGIFAQLCASLGVETELMLQVWSTREFSRQIGALSEFVKMMTNRENGYNRKMWRYGRIFNENFMSTLQTKSCPKFVYILASMLKTEDPAKCRNILEIVQIINLSDEVKMKCSAVGQNWLSKVKAVKHGKDLC